MQGTAAIGIIGLGVMGRNLALNIADRGFAVAGFDTAEASRAAAAGEGIAVAGSVAELLARLAAPRHLLLMVPAGSPVDAALDELLPRLAPDALVIDGGNSHWRDTERRVAAAAARGVRYLGVGISGGEEGARHGPAIMAGGDRTGWERAGPMLEAIAARTRAGPCCAWLGPGGAGHFVKMVHNGIEYAVMQLIAEAWAQLRDCQGLPAAAAADAVAGWRARGDSFLLAITERVLRETDPLSGRPLVEMIVDEAEQKGTGAWASIAAIELGVPAPTLLEAAQARSLSALKTLRSTLAARAGARGGRSSRLDAGAVGDALRAATGLAYVQGFMVLRAAGPAFGWPLDLATVARIWQGGCIIRADFLQGLEQAASAAPAATTLLEDEALAAGIEADVGALRRFVAEAALTGQAAPAHASALAWQDGIRTARGPADLIQAQRDLFGAHRFARTDRPGRFHHAWGELP